MMKTKHGVIVLLDALGISTHSIEESKVFLKNRGVVVKLIEEFSHGLLPQEKFGTLKAYTFGDTLLLTCEIREIVGPPLVVIGRLLRYIVAESIEKHILWRGAISVGEYIEDEKSNTLIGPAIGSAVTWYEAANWFGVMTTPRCSLVVKRLFEEMAGSAKVMKDLSETFIDYDVPLKRGKTLRVPAIGWPFELLKSKTVVSSGGNTITPLASLCKMLSAFSIPAKTEDKYFNAIEFFSHCQKETGK